MNFLKQITKVSRLSTMVRYSRPNLYYSSVAFISSDKKHKEDASDRKKYREDLERLKPAEAPFLTKERYVDDSATQFKAQYKEDWDEPRQMDDPSYQREEKLETPAAATSTTDAECSTLYPEETANQDADEFAMSKQNLGESPSKGSERSQGENVKANQGANDLDREADELRKETEKRRAALLKEESKPNKTMFDLRTEQDFDNLTNSSKKPIIIDFYRRGSEGCRRLYPQLMDKFITSQEEWSLVGANIEKFESLAKKYNVSDTPSVLIIHEGKVVESLSGSESQQNLDSLISKVNELAKK